MFCLVDEDEFIGSIRMADMRYVTQPLTVKQQTTRSHKHKPVSEVRQTTHTRAT